ASGNEQLLQPQDSLIYGTRTNNPAHENEYEIMVDYLQPLQKDIKLGVGGKFSAYDISRLSDASVWKSFYKDYSYDSTRSNDLNYHQKVYAFYSELSFPVGQLFEAKIGGRYERTQLNSFYSNAHQQVNKDYNTFVPSIFLMKKLTEKQTLN